MECFVCPYRWKSLIIYILKNIEKRKGISKDMHIKQYIHHVYDITDNSNSTLLWLLSPFWVEKLPEMFKYRKYKHIKVLINHHDHVT